MNNPDYRAYLAEFIGTFTLVFIGAVAVMVAGQNDYEVTVPALAHGLILVGLIYAYGHISGAHFNPAVTLGLLVGGKISPVKAGIYLVMQFAGGIVAGFLLGVVVVDPGNYGQTIGSLTATDVWNAAVIEAILAFFLVSAIYQAAAFERAGNLAGVAIGLTLAACIFAGGPLTGASVNPARTLGPALAAGDLSYTIPYLIGLFAGGAIAGLVNSYLLRDDAGAKTA